MIASLKYCKTGRELTRATNFCRSPFRTLEHKWSAYEISTGLHKLRPDSRGRRRGRATKGMDSGGPQWVPSLSLRPAVSSWRLATSGHGQTQSLAAILNRHRRSLLAGTMTSSGDDEPPPLLKAEAPVGRVSDRAETRLHYADDQQKTAAIALRLSPPQPATGTTNLERDQANQLGARQLGNYVNPDLVRDLIVRHSIELTIILVILIYLVYYYSRISRVSLECWRLRPSPNGCSSQATRSKPLRREQPLTR